MSVGLGCAVDAGAVEKGSLLAFFALEVCMGWTE